MLEPLYTCNLACLGCSVERHTGKLKDRMSLETCFKAAEDCGAPIVNICGGEPTLYPELKELIAGLIERGKYIIMCTNALKLDTKVFDVIPPSDHFFLMIHLDGMRQTHDYVCNREGVFDKAVEMIKKARERGYHVYINTTVFKETSVEEVEDLCTHGGRTQGQRHSDLPRLRVRERGARHLPDQRPDSRQVQANSRLLAQVQGERHARLSGIRGGPARAAPAPPGPP